MNMQAPNAIADLRSGLDRMAPQFAAVLPSQLDVERFKRVVLTAVQQQPALVHADRQSFWNSAMKAAQDGLLPDGREAAFVVFKTRKKDAQGVDRWIEAVQYMPMIAGIRKLVRGSGEITAWDTHVVYAEDDFDFELGDEPFIHHKPRIKGDPGPVVAAYSIAVLKGGEKSREVMTVAEIERVRAFSKSKDVGPWATHYGEMCRKTVAKRHAKSLPMSSDVLQVLQRDNDDEIVSQPATAPKPARPKLSDFSTPDEPPAPEPEAPDFGPADTYDLGYQARQTGDANANHGIDAAWTDAMKEAFATGWRDADDEITAATEGKSS